jgi:hypothetical protein
MARTWRRQRCRYEYPSVLYELRGLYPYDYIPVDRHSRQGRTLLARYHADQASGHGGCAPRWYCRYDSRRVKNRNREMLHRWLRGPICDPVFQDKHFHNASWSYW